MSRPNVVIEVIGEGKTDVGALKTAGRIEAEQPTSGIVPVLLHNLCGRPTEMRVIRRSFADLQRKGGLDRKVLYAKVQAFYSGRDGVVFVVDTEGKKPDRKRKEMAEGRDEKLTDYPMAIGVAHPCIEAWLLADAPAIARGLGLSNVPQVPQEPEALPAPWKRSGNDLKIELARCAGQNNPLSSSDTTKIASAIEDPSVIERNCPLGFGPFAAEVRERIRPLFGPPAAVLPDAPS
jgi:hypothetical protein